MTKTARLQPVPTEPDAYAAAAAPLASLETATAAPAERKPGRYEAEGLQAMNEIETPRSEPTHSWLACPDPTNANGTAYHLFKWQRGVNAWRRVGEAVYSRSAAIARLAEEVAHSDVALTDEFVCIDDRERDALDDLLCEGRTLVCPEGVPGRADLWAAIHLDRRGVGQVLAPSLRFPQASLRQRFLAAAPKEPGDHRERTILVRHGRAARNVVDRARWGITGRPDLMGRQIDEGLARDAQERADTERAWREDGVRLSDVPAYRARRQALGTW